MNAALCERLRSEEYELNKLLGLAASLLVSGCSIMTVAYTTFDEDLEGLLGENVNEAYIWRLGYLRDIEPNDTQELVSGNKIYTYEIEYQTREFLFTEPNKTWHCTVKLEIDPQSENIKSATSVGEGCWRPV